MTRNKHIDYIRASAIVLMVFFHFMWNLNFFKFISIQIPNGPFWREFRMLIVSLFLFSMGVSLVYSFKEGIALNRLTRRFIKISFAALLVTITTMLTLPNHWVYFGILHFIAAATLLVVWFVDKPKLALILAGVVMAVYLLTDIHSRWPLNYIQHLLPSRTVDLVTLLPWLAVPLFGIWAGHTEIFQKSHGQEEHNQRSVLFLSKHSLIIYLIHQPLLFGGVYLAYLAAQK